MNDLSGVLPGLARIQGRFVSMLEDRHSSVAAHALAAWEAGPSEEARAELSAAQHILHQITGTAGSLGFADLGDIAHRCEQHIIAFTEGTGALNAPVNDELMQLLDQFVEMSRMIIDNHG